VRTRAATPVLVRRLAAALDAPGGPAAREHLLVAVSGGPDSTALLAALAELAPGRGLGLTVAHVDHGLRGAEGAAEADRVAALAARLGVPFVRRAAAVPAGPDLEARARGARYQALVGLADEVGAQRIVTGHTQDDQVETLLLRLLRGAGRRGLGGMRPVRGRLLRPLLAATRADVRRFLAERGLDFAVDRTNADLRHARNRVRRLLVPLLRAEFNPRLGPALAALAERLRDEDDFLATAAAARARELVVGDHLRTAVVAEAPALARRIVRSWLERGARRGVGAGHVARVLALAAGRERGAIAIPGPARVVREGDVLVRRPGRAPAPSAFAFEIGPGRTVVHPAGGWRVAVSPPRARRAGETRPTGAARALFDADQLPGGLVLRSPARGDRVRLLAGGTRKLQDVLVDAKVPRETRALLPVLAAGPEILWVPGLARGAGAPVGPTTTRVVEAVFERDPPEHARE
jgi:tRNA(Ile)-lysidine synthase